MAKTYKTDADEALVGRAFQVLCARLAGCGTMKHSPAQDTELIEDCFATARNFAVIVDEQVVAAEEEEPLDEEAP